MFKKMKAKKQIKCTSCGQMVKEEIVVCQECFNKICSTNCVSDNISIWKSVVSMWDQEANRFWTRNNIFILVNSGLFAIQTGFKIDNIIKLIIAILGIIFVFNWIKINRIGKFYLNRWKPIAINVEKLINVEVISILPSKKPASTKKFELILIVFLIVWFLLFMHSLISCFKFGITFSL